MKTVYLCGGINGLTDAAAKNWREWAADRLADKFHVLDPMRRDFRGLEDDNAAEIVRGDLADIRAADVILANAIRPSWGAAMEIFYADQILRPVVAVTPYHRGVSPWLRFHSWRLVRTLDDAVSLIREEWGR